jgi:hypothetical protein
MPSGLNIEDGVYIEEPVRMGAVMRVSQDVSWKQSRPPAYTDHATFRCKWCEPARRTSA